MIHINSTNRIVGCLVEFNNHRESRGGSHSLTAGWLGLEVPGDLIMNGPINVKPQLCREIACFCFLCDLT